MMTRGELLLQVESVLSEKRHQPTAVQARAVVDVMLDQVTLLVTFKGDKEKLQALRQPSPPKQ